MKCKEFERVQEDDGKCSHPWVNGIVGCGGETDNCVIEEPEGESKRQI